jgi:hypothetical protein
MDLKNLNEMVYFLVMFNNNYTSKILTVSSVEKLVAFTLLAISGFGIIFFHQYGYLSHYGIPSQLIGFSLGQTVSSIFFALMLMGTSSVIARFKGQGSVIIFALLSPILFFLLACLVGKFIAGSQAVYSVEKLNNSKIVIFAGDNVIISTYSKSKVLSGEFEIYTKNYLEKNNVVLVSKKIGPLAQSY